MLDSEVEGTGLSELLPWRQEFKTEIGMNNDSLEGWSFTVFVFRYLVT